MPYNLVFNRIREQVVLFCNVYNVGFKTDATINGWAVSMHSPRTGKTAKRFVPYGTEETMQWDTFLYEMLKEVEEADHGKN